DGRAEHGAGRDVRAFPEAVHGVAHVLDVRAEGPRGLACCSYVLSHVRSPYQLEVKSNRSPLSRMLRATRPMNSTAGMTPAQTNMTRCVTVATAGTARTRSIHAATKSTATKLTGTRYFQHMSII